LEWEQEIDLRVYIAAVLRYKFWIAGLAALSAFVALGISLVLPKTFEGQALVAILEPQYILRFDERIEDPDPTVPAYRAYPTLALSDEVLSSLIEVLGEYLAPEERTIRTLREKLSASQGSDPSLVSLTVQDDDPERAAAIANAWATVFARHANETYGQSEQQLSFFQTQMENAQADLTAAEQAMIELQARDPSSILQAQLSSKRAALNEYLNTSRSVRFIVQDARSLQERLRSQDEQSRSSLGDELTALFLQVDALNRSSLPVQLQISGEGLATKTVGEQIQFLDSLIAVLEAKLELLEDQAQSIEPEIMALQQQLQQAVTDQNRLDRELAVAREAYVSLARKVAEAQIAAQDTAGTVRLASVALPQDKPVSPHPLRNGVIGGALGLLVGVMGALALVYWRQGEVKTSDAR
jgi:uncharacterized protein involved in exopolysaccharide biosynthesis